MMKNFRRFLVTFAMLFVIVLTTACSNKVTNNENKKEEKEKVEVEDTTPKEKKNPSKTFVKETPGYKQTVTYYYIESEDRIVFQETTTESTYEAYKIGGGNKEKIQKILKEVNEHQKGYSWIKNTLELRDDGFKTVTEINFGTLIYEEAQKVFGENYINPHKEKFSMKQTEDALLKGGYVEKK
jgi:lipoprotein